MASRLSLVSRKVKVIQGSPGSESGAKLFLMSPLIIWKQSHVQAWPTKGFFCEAHFQYYGEQNSITKTQKISTWNMETFLCKVHTIMQMTVCKYVSLNEMFKPHHKIWQPNWMSFNASCNIEEKKLFKELRQLKTTTSFEIQLQIYR